VAEAPIPLGFLATQPVTALKRVGPKKAEALASMGVENLLDLLTHYPRRYIDRTNEATIAQLLPGEEGLVLVEVRSVGSRRTRNGKVLVEVRVSDGTGTLTCSFFNQSWRERQLPPGTQVVLYGKVEEFRGARRMTNPVVDLVGDRTGRIVPVYPQSEKAGLHTWEIGGWVRDTLARCQSRTIEDAVPGPILARHGLVDRWRAIREIHDPQSMAEMAEARRRLVFDELLRIQLSLVLRKRALERDARGVEHRIGGALLARFHRLLPFPLTGAQERAIGEILDDLRRPVPMHRLLQGDVGAGKTLVAVSAMLAGVEGGHQGALMAPTEVLAEQHHAGVARLLDGLTVVDDATLLGERPVRVALLTSRTTAAERRTILRDLAGGGVDILVGTHALLSAGVDFRSLGVVVIDEQHRFGVEQRAALRDKGRGAVPDVLVMTATPIPRTAAMTVYGDLDVSVLDELPPGRTPIRTTWARTPDEEAAVWSAVRAAVAEGRQAYVVCPLIEESESLEVRSAEETHAELVAGELAELEVGLLHGRLPPAEKDAVMERFRHGSLQVLVATTVIEVGVDVPNATVMAILDAARFGIAQLHQLRGRVGRGRHASVCFLMGETTTPDGEERLAALVRTTDGFELAEVDLDLRGEGTIMGERQKGRNDLRLASLRRDREWVVAAREAAFEIVDADPELAGHPALAGELRLFVGDEDAAFLLKS
jgi:ATP-dependent DNA helicase RecG